MDIGRAPGFRKAVMTFRHVSWFVVAAAVLVAGCGPPQGSFVHYETVGHKIGLEQLGNDFSSEQWRDIDLAMVTLFGTPDDPALPALEEIDIAETMSLSRLKLAAGRVG